MSGNVHLVAKTRASSQCRLKLSCPALAQSRKCKTAWLEEMVEEKQEMELHSASY